MLLQSQLFNNCVFFLSHFIIYHEKLYILNSKPVKLRNLIPQFLEKIKIDLIFILTSTYSSNETVSSFWFILQLACNIFITISDFFCYYIELFMMTCNIMCMNVSDLCVNGLFYKIFSMSDKRLLVMILA